MTSAVVTAMCYFISIMVGSFFYNIIFDIPFDRNRVISGIFIGSFVTIIPYVLLGIYISLICQNKPLKNSIFIGLFVILSERLSLFLIGFNFVSAGTDGWTYERLLSPINFVYAEALPYFTLFYIIVGGTISLLLCLITTFVSLKFRFKKRLEPIIK